MELVFCRSYPSTYVLRASLPNFMHPSGDFAHLSDDFLRLCCEPAWLYISTFDLQFCFFAPAGEVFNFRISDLLYSHHMCLCLSLACALLALTHVEFLCLCALLIHLAIQVCIACICQAALALLQGEGSEMQDVVRAATARMKS